MEMRHANITVSPSTLIAEVKELYEFIQAILMFTVSFKKTQRYIMRTCNE